MPGGMPMVLIGDVFFRRNVVMFDLTHFPGPITIGIAKRDPSYKLATRHSYVSKIQAHKVLPQVTPSFYSIGRHAGRVSVPAC